MRGSQILKKFLALLFVFAPLRANATHTYDEEVCNLDNGKVHLSFYGQLSDDLFVIEAPTGISEISAAYLGKGDVARLDPAFREDLVVKIVKDTRKKKLHYDDGCFKGLKGSFRREATIVRLSERATNELNLKKSQTLKLVCTWQAISPTDKCLGRIDD